MAPGIRSSLAVVSTNVCSAALSIGLSADTCCLWHDESRVTAPSAMPVIRAMVTTLSFVFMLELNYSAILITPRCWQHEFLSQLLTFRQKVFGMPLALVGAECERPHLSAQREAVVFSSPVFLIGSPLGERLPVNCWMNSSSGFELAGFSCTLIPACSLRIRLSNVSSTLPAPRGSPSLPLALLINSRLGTSGCTLLEN